MGRVCREEAGVIAIFVIRQRNETQVGKFKFARFRDHHLRWDLCLIASTEIIQVDRQVGDCATGLRAADLYAPTIVDEAFHHVGGKRERGIGPQILFMVRAFHFFHIVETAHRHGIWSIWQTTQHTRHGQTDIAGVIRIAEGFPLDVFGAVKVVANVFDGRDLLHVLFEEELRSDGANKGHGRGRHLGDVTQQRHVLRGGIKFVCRNNGPDGLATRGVILGDVGVGIQTTLDNFRAVFKILAQIVFRDIQHIDFHVLTKIGAID
ncbi:hypothetical protein D3C85_1200530 [compost metagenome]